MNQPQDKLDDLELFRLIQLVNREIHETRKKAQSLNEFMRCFQVDYLDQLKGLHRKLQTLHDRVLQELKEEAHG